MLCNYFIVHWMRIFSRKVVWWRINQSSMGLARHRVQGRCKDITNRLQRLRATFWSLKPTYKDTIREFVKRITELHNEMKSYIWRWYAIRVFGVKKIVLFNNKVWSLFWCYWGNTISKITNFTGVVECTTNARKQIWIWRKSIV